MVRTTLVFIALLPTVLQGGAQFPEPSDVTHKLVLRGTPKYICMAFSPDGRRFAAAEKEIVIWDTEKAKEIKRLQAVKEIKRVRDGVTALAFNAEGTLLASGNYDGVIKVWDAATGKERLSIKRRRGPMDPIITLAFHADNKCLVSICGPDLWAVPRYEITVWNLSTGRERRAIKGEGASFGFKGLSLSPNCRVVAAGNFGRKLTIWDVTTGRAQYTLDEPILGRVVFSPDSKSFAAFVSGEAIIVWEVATGKAMRSLKTPSKDHYAERLAFSPDGKCLSAIVTSYQKLDPTKETRKTSALYVWEIASGKEVLRKEVHGGVGESVFRANGDYHALNNGDGTIQISKKLKAKK